MYNTIIALALAATFAAGVGFQNETCLLIVFSFSSYYALISYYTGFQRSAGLITTTLSEPDTVSDMYWLVYVCALAALWKYNVIWAALMTPWVVQISLVNIMSYLVHFDIIAIVPADDEDE